MPIYEYRCDACSYEFEAVQKITELPLQTCERCRTDAAKRKVSRSSFVLKGGGWYSDGYSQMGSKPKPTGTQERAGPSASASQQ